MRTRATSPANPKTAPDRGLFCKNDTPGADVELCDGADPAPLAKTVLVLTIVCLAPAESLVKSGAGDEGVDGVAGGGAGAGVEGEGGTLDSGTELLGGADLWTC